MLEYAIVFVLTSTSKYAYVRYHRIFYGNIYSEIRSYLQPDNNEYSLFVSCAGLIFSQNSLVDAHRYLFT